MNHDYTTIIWVGDITIRVRTIVNPNDPTKSSVAVHTNRYEGIGWVEVPPERIDHYGVLAQHRKPWERSREPRRFTD